jgi:hypothetical protein
MAEHTIPIPDPWQMGRLVGELSEPETLSLLGAVAGKCDEEYLLAAVAWFHGNRPDLLRAVMEPN